ncbi:hypothetical protein ACFYZJ_36625 [Streptomyces sp. NPDC001848]|uniref:hypothetical protein n=1 Tax=Streptomyces sp. NPDC001848 TaxID=3364618 RepID=UPI0036CB690B
MTGAATRSAAHGTVRSGHLTERSGGLTGKMCDGSLTDTEKTPSELSGCPPSSVPDHPRTALTSQNGTDVSAVPER